MRSCRYCGSEFTPLTSRHTICGDPECKKLANRDRTVRWAAAHPNGNRDASRKYRDKNGYEPWPAKRALGLEIEGIKSSTPCTDCGTVYPPECMDFDHVGDDKIANVGTMVAHGHSRARVMEEISKCELVCANCHRIRTRSRRSKESETVG